MSAVPAESEKEPAPGMWPQFLPNLKKNKKFFKIKYINKRKHRKNMKLTIIAKNRETRTRFLLHTSIHDKLGWLTFWFLQADNSYVSLQRWTAKMQTGSYVSLHRQQINYH